MRGGPKPLIAIVQRRKDKDWVLPKGKLKPKENAISAARREAIEETGHNVFVREFLGAISYQAGGKPKVVQFWRMQAADGPRQEPMRHRRGLAAAPVDRAAFQPLERCFSAMSAAARLLMRPAAPQPGSKRRAVRKIRPCASRRPSSCGRLACRISGQILGRFMRPGGRRRTEDAATICLRAAMPAQPSRG